MLTSLHIRNLAVLDEVAVELGEGFSALTGETGAGKSMLVDALALALGSRADSSVVRMGAQRAEATAVFDLRQRAGAACWLAERDLDSSAECQIRRVVTPEGRSRGYINGQQVPMELLREFGSQLVEICGQHAHQAIAARATQRDLLDAHGNHAGLLAAVATAHGAWSALDQERNALLTAQQDRQARRDLLAYQVKELQALNLQAGELEALERERLLLTHASRLTAGISQALERIYDADENSAHDAVGSAERDVTTLADIDPSLQPAAEALSQARIYIAEAAEQLRHRLSGAEHDPGRQDVVESRLATIQELARKHRSPPELLWRQLAAMEADLAGIEANTERLGKLAAEIARHAEVFHVACTRLSAARAKAARSLSTAVTENLHKLGMPASVFQVRVEPMPDEQAGASGADSIEFLVATNAGQVPGPIGKVASGGELSRLSLAIQVVAMAAHGVATLVFDEVDAGIGGGVAEIVGQCLRRLSADRQVLCVTHLAQVASQADHHFAVWKSSERGCTSTAVRELGTGDRVDEIARMLGGVKITERTRAHAREMLNTARPRRAG